MIGPGVRSFLAAVLPALAVLALFLQQDLIAPLPALLLAAAVTLGALYAVRRRVRAEKIALDRLNRMAEEAEAQAEALRYKASVADRIVSSLPDPLLFLDRRRRVVRANRGAERLLDKDLVGRDIGEGLRHPDLLAAVDRALASRGRSRSRSRCPARRPPPSSRGSSRSRRRRAGAAPTRRNRRCNRCCWSICRTSRR